MNGFNLPGYTFFATIGVVFWVISYLVQRKGSRQSRYLHLPEWSVWLLGRPLGDTQIDVVPASLQVLGLVLASLDPILYFFGFPQRARGEAWIGTFILGMVCVAATRVWSEMENRREFDRAITDSFAFLTREYMFRLVRKKDPVTFESSAYTLRVRVLQWKVLIITIQPKQSEKVSRELGVSSILYCLEGRVPEFDEESLTRTSITLVLRRNSQLLREHCSFVLTGDLEVWKRIEECDTKYSRKGPKTRR